MGDSMRVKQFWKDPRGVSPVIAVVLLVAITVVLVSVLYFSVSGMITKTRQTPVTALDFVESDEVEGEYTGGIVSISEKVKLPDVSLTLIDSETGEAALISPLVDNGQAEAGAPGEAIHILYNDANDNNQLDTSDVFYITNGTAGDKVTLSYIPTDGLLDYYIIRY
jgi:flagellin-like protein